MDNNYGYLKRAWSELTSVTGWWQPIAILTLVAAIPVVGLLIVCGYMLDWAREAAWGMDRPLRRKADHIGRWLKWGFFASIIVFVWGIVPDIAQWLLGWIPVLGWIIALACFVASIVFSVLSMVGAVNMSIYDRFKAGFQVKRIFGMAKRDVDGLLRCFGIGLLSLIPVFLAFIIVLGPLLASLGIYGVSSSTMLDSAVNVHSDAVSALAGIGIFTSWGVFAIIVLFVAGFFVIVCMALEYRAFGYWVAQFEPAKWNGIDAPMPHEPGYVPPAPAGAAANAAASQGTTFNDVAESAAAAAATAGAFVKEKAASAADAAKTAAEGLKADHVEPDDGQPLEAEVVSVEDAVAGAIEGEAGAAAPEAPEADATPVADAAPAADAADVPAAPESAAPESDAPAAPESDTSEAAPDEPAPAFCTACGTPVKEGQNFCVNCGAKL